MNDALYVETSGTAPVPLSELDIHSRIEARRKAEQEMMLAQSSMGPSGKKFAKRTPHEKRTRMSGKLTEKPYISSSIGDMVRLMQRMACTEDTLGMTEPPPAEFYDYWKKFTITKEEERLPTEFIDKKKVSTARIKMNTSSFDFFGKHMTNAEEQHDVAMDEKKKDKGHKLAPTLSDLWQKVRISMSTESFISSSTKVSEPHDNVLLEMGWSDSEIEESSESDIEVEPILGSNPSLFQAVFAGVPSPSSHYNLGTAGIESSKKVTDNASSKHGTIASDDDSELSIGTRHKEGGGVKASILHMQLEEQRVAMEQALKMNKEHHDIVDYFMDDIDDTFLVDAISYGQLPDSAFTSDFDYFNEDPIFRERERERERIEQEALLALQGKDKNADKSKSRRKSKDDEFSDTSFEGGSEEEEEDEQDEEMNAEEAPSTKQTKSSHIDYETCIERQKKRIEDNLRAAVRKRSPMGSYKIPPGGKPLARTFAFKTPGPAAYYPDVNAVKPKPQGVFLAKRWNKSICETPGPGPAAYQPDCRQCTGEIRTCHKTPRFPTDVTVGPGPAEYSTADYAGTGKDKPHALILSRRPDKKIGEGSSHLTNVYGISRTGRHNPPKALLLSRHLPKDKRQPGPGAYDPTAIKDTRVGIILKSRIPPLEPEIQPGYVDLPSFIGTGPGVPLGIRKFEILNSDSPGPIYYVPPPTPNGLSMTFRPFPSPGRESEPSPLQYGTKPGDMSLKHEFIRAPRPVMIGTHNLDYGIGKTPGPNKYKVQNPNRKIGIKIKGKYNTKQEVLPGPADYHVGKSHYSIPPRTVFQTKPKDKDAGGVHGGFVYEPFNPNHTTTGVLMSSRWPSNEDTEKGPQYTNLYGLTSRGKYSKIPISLKSRHSPFVYTHLSPHAEILKQCKGGAGLPPPPTKAQPKPVFAKC